MLSIGLTVSAVRAELMVEVSPRMFSFVAALFTAQSFQKAVIEALSHFSRLPWQCRAVHETHTRMGIHIVNRGGFAANPR